MLQRELEQVSLSSNKISDLPSNCLSLSLFLFRLGLQYVDLYLMHSPSGGKTLETWDAMIELKQQGKIKYVNHNPVGYRQYRLDIRKKKPRSLGYRLWIAFFSECNIENVLGTRLGYGLSQSYSVSCCPYYADR